MSDRKAVVKGETAKFTKLLEASGKLFSLPNRCQGTHVFVPTSPAEITKESHGLHLKFSVVAQDGSVFCQSAMRASFDGWMVIWNADNDNMIVANLFDFDSRGYKTCLKIMKNFIVKKEGLASHLLDLHRASIDRLQSYTSANSMLKFVMREKHDNHEREATAQAEIAALFDDGEYFKTNEGCLADSYIRTTSATSVFPMQIKSSTLNKSGAFHFAQCDGYETMLVICKPIPEVGFSAIIPGCVSKGSVEFKVTSQTYSKYFVNDNHLRSVLFDISKAVDANKATFKMPSGHQIGIGQLVKVSENTVDIPTNKNQQTELMNYLWRQKQFPSLHFSRPMQQHSVVDLLINSIRVQDKVAQKAVRGSYFDVCTSKNAGKVNGKHITQPYQVGDWDALFIFMLDRQSFFFIPADELDMHGVLRSDKSPGKKGMLVYGTGYTGIGNNWTSDFRYDLEDAKMSEKFLLAVERLTHKLAQAAA